ncbi:substrate-binding domain-containing protein [Grimontia sp. NTOU-MAR1]|uniref:substrate-binding domain-containing protein n=1 Tax=Grimontia sp. NTOU-MAR1 TaxID=3111011 RepID=UPI002DB72491|nr:substrate-binding domain-containing protein [Grimontia sp. NTOU-MAR1]WRV98187.1 substrate-binding domain-containing protein [Grimontia sp. NTOU-MAR1]
MEKNRRPTMNDVAKRVGVTKMTVSRYLKYPHKVAKKTGEKIQIALDELGYIPNRVPDILSNRSSKALGVILPSLCHSVFQQVLAGIETVAEENGYQVMLAHGGYSAETEQQRIESLLSFNVDGLILADSDHTQKSLKMIQTAGISYVEIMESTPKNTAQSVGIDNELAAFSMVTLMIERGFEHIVCLNVKKGIRTSNKLQGYVDAMEDAGLTPRSITAKAESSVSLARKMATKVFDRYPDTDAFFCTDDELAAGVLIECQSQGLSVPEQIGIAGIHALDIGQSMMPKLASVITPDRETGEHAALALLSQIHGAQIDIEPLGFDIDEGESLSS